MTRAQGLLYLTHSVERMQGAETRSQEVSIFLKKLIKQSSDKGSPLDCIFTPKLPEVDSRLRQELSAVIGRPTAPDDVIKSRIEEYESKERKTFTIPDPSGKRYSYPGSSQESKQAKLQSLGTESGTNSNRSVFIISGQTSRQCSSSWLFSNNIWASHIYFGGKYDPNAQGSGNTSKPLINGSTGKFSSKPLRTLSQPTQPVKVSTLHKPFVPPSHKFPAKNQL
ncbi:hypothetical protein PGTUg99_000205 [Puccinia graminis f. sp. tritici]|uniref:Uncharacterized protein n=1 Tax=Puccinia graminis f. sp. tritici TaxID=56615 RepID=A0A5B0QZC6_PUCGR|nr:hypothetical protein PGTUg99_000205 [Puccinia graminis f. sp. tritici]